MEKLKKLSKLIRDAWLMAGITILLFCLIECGFSLAYFIKDRFRGSEPSEVDYRIKADTYSNSVWARKYFEEFWHERDYGWKPYVYWRRKSFSGEYINVDANGIRRTTVTEPKPPMSGPMVKIFMFGGSALWGTGARDAFTIPSCLAKELQDRGVATEIINFGESGYVSTQEVISLLLQLQNDHIPHLVIFYDGVNDTFSAYQYRVAGVTQNEFNRVQEFNLSQPEKYKRRRNLVLRDVATRFSTIRFLKDILPQPLVRRMAEPAVNTLLFGDPAPNDESLAKEVLNKHSSNIQLVKALSKQYRFQYLFYWQPTIFQKPHLTKYEKEELEKMKNIEPLFRKTYDSIRQSRLDKNSEYHFHDLSQIFAEIQEPLYIDWCHLGERGNQLIAKAIAQDVFALITAKKNL